MPTSPLPGLYHIELEQVSIDIQSNQPKEISPLSKPLYLTSNGEGKQLTLEHPTGHKNQEVN